MRKANPPRNPFIVANPTQAKDRGARLFRCPCCGRLKALV